MCFAPLAPRDGTDQLGRERGLERGPSETNAAFAQRVVDAWGLWQWAGSAQGCCQATRPKVADQLERLNANLEALVSELKLEREAGTNGTEAAAKGAGGR